MRKPRLRAATALVAVAVSLQFPQPAHAARTGTIEGRVLNETTGRPASGVKVVVLGGRRGADGTIERTIEETAETGKDGRYRFEGLAVGDDRLYVIDATYKGGLYSGRPLTLPSGTGRPPVIETTLRVWEPTTDPASVLISRDSLFVRQAEGGTAVLESVTIVNQTQNAYVGRPGGDGEPGEESTFGFSLPASARDGLVQIEDASLEIPRLLREPEFGFSIPSAIPPGETRVAFSYLVPGSGGNFDLSRTALYDIVELTVFTSGNLEIESNRLAEEGIETIEGDEYTKWGSDDVVDAADPIQILVVAAATNDRALAIGATIAGAVLALIAGLSFVRARRAQGRRLERPPVPQAEDDRESVVAAIAALDLRYEAGELTEEEWEARRRTLKSRLATSGAPR